MHTVQTTDDINTLIKGKDYSQENIILEFEHQEKINSIPQKIRTSWFDLSETDSVLWIVFRELKRNENGNYRYRNVKRKNIADRVKVIREVEGYVS